MTSLVRSKVLEFFLDYDYYYYSPCVLCVLCIYLLFSLLYIFRSHSLFAVEIVQKYIYIYSFLYITFEMGTFTW